MAAYAALVSVMQIIDQIKLHPYPPISLSREQLESLTTNISFLQQFLEAYNPRVSYCEEVDPLENRIAEAAYAAEDVIETYIVDQILARSTNHGNANEVDSLDNLIAGDQILDPPTNDGEKISCIEFFQCVPTLMSNISHRIQEFLEGYHPRVSYNAAEDVIESCTIDQIPARSTDDGENIDSIEFYQGLQKVIEEMDLIKLEINMEMKDKMGVQIKKSLSYAASFRSSSTAQKLSMVGLDDVLNQMLEKMVGGGLRRQIIPIVGMGGLGKTTLARNIFANQLIKEHFDICAWSTISQEYNTRKILGYILSQVGEENRGDLSEYELGEQLYKYLIGRRYLIVMDDMWSTEAWDVFGKFFPDNENGSRIVITTRLSNLATNFNYANGLQMKFLNKASSWNLFSKTVFGGEICPLELDDIGKKIVIGCKGLPLSIVVIGGLLSKSEPTRKNWEIILENLNSIVNLEDNGRCLQILYMSYNNLPCCVKPCFLYMGIVLEDDEILVYMLIPLLVAEGFIKPIDGKSLEEAAEEYLEDLVDRNLLLVEERNHFGKLKSCKMHDLVRDVCLREGEMDKFLGVLAEQSLGEIPQGIGCQRRIATTVRAPYPPNPLLESLEAASSLVRSLIGKFPKTLSLSSFRLLRVCLVDFFYDGEENRKDYYEEIFIRLVNLRFLFVDIDEQHPLSSIPFPVSFMWNLQTLCLGNIGGDYILEIWKMPLLRHVMADGGTLDASYCLPPLSLSGDGDEVVLENLQTLYVLRNLKFCEGVLKRIPNIKMLNVEYYDEEGYYLNNLCFLHKLEDLRLSCSSTCQLTPELTVPYSLRKLTLQSTKLPWGDMETKIGSLPLLQVLELKENAFIGSEWETFEDQFSSLKFLLIERCNLENWTTDNTHFPCLERLVFRRLTRLREIPLSIGDVPMLRSIELEDCSDSAVESIGRVVEEQEDLGNEDLHVQVRQSSPYRINFSPSNIGEVQVHASH